MNTRTRRRTTASGFSLIEVVLVITLIVVIMGVATLSLGGAASKAKTKATITAMDTVTQGLQAYNLDYNSYPPNLQALVTTKIMDETRPIKDGWGRDLFYVTPGLDSKPYVLISLGEDGQASTADDIDAWTMHIKKP